MRVGLLVNSLTGGGAERQAAVWASVCAGAGEQVRLLALHGTSTAFPLPGEVRVDHAGKRGAADVLRLAAQVRRWARDLDVVAAFQPYPALLCWLAHVRAPWMVVVGDDPREHWGNARARHAADPLARNPDATRVPARMLRRAFSRASAASAPANGLVECYRALGIGPAGPWLAIPNIIPDAAFEAPAGARDGALFVGRLVPQKDPLMAVEVAARADVPLTVLGAGPLEAATRRRAEETGATVRFAGFRPAPWPVYAEHRMLLLTSRYEPFGNVIVESLGTGTPVVAGDCDFGPREILAGAHASRVVPRTVERLAEAVRLTAAEPYDGAARRECRAIAERYTEEAVRPAVLGALERVRRSGTPTPRPWRR